MARARYPFWTHDTVAAAVLAGVGMASLQSKLDGVANELNVPVVTALVHGWPMVALFASLALLVMRSVGEAEESANDMENGKRDEIDLAGVAASELDRAVGGGLEPVQNKVPDGGQNWASGEANSPSPSVRPEDVVFAAALVGRVAICGEEHQTRYASRW
jgi:hypothetical protein